MRIAEILAGLIVTLGALNLIVSKPQFLTAGGSQLNTLTSTLVTPH